MPDTNPAQGGDAPASEAAGAPEASSTAQSRESREREVAVRRGELRRSGHAEPQDAARDPYSGQAPPDVAQRAFAVLADNVRDFAIFLLNAEGVITFWGESARNMKWWTREQAEGGHLRMLYPDGGSEDGTAEAHIREAEETGEYTGEGQRIRAGGSTFWAGVSLTALRDTEGRLLGFAKVTRDLTARRAAEAVLKAARDEAEEARVRAEEANHTKSLFLATMSHEIRTPINAVMGYVDLLDLEIAGALNEAQRGQLGRIRSSNLHLLGIIDEILDFSRLDAGRVTLARQAGRLSMPIQSALQMVQTQAEAKGVELSDRVSGLAADVPYRGDEDRVRQILVILLSNAVKFTPAGGTITVSAGTAQEPPPDARLQGAGPWVYARVEDTGQGIPSARMAAIFEPFEQADMSLTREHGGTGLGLTIAKRLALLMGGDLTARSEPGVGSGFFLWLSAATEEGLDSTLAGDGQAQASGPGLLEQVRDAIMVEMDRVLHAYSARLRSDPAVPSASSVTEAELEDHLAAFLSDLAVSFSAMELAKRDGGEVLRDSSALQRGISERHGAQRRRLGWAEAEIRREFHILGEEISAAIQRRFPDVRPGELEPVLDAVGTAIRGAEQGSLASFNRPAQPRE